MKTIGIIPCVLLAAASLAPAGTYGFFDGFHNAGTTLGLVWTSTATEVAVNITDDHLSVAGAGEWFGPDTVAASSFLAQAPTGDYVATMKLNFAPTDNVQGAGIIVTSANHQNAIKFSYVYSDNNDGCFGPYNPGPPPGPISLYRGMDTIVVTGGNLSWPYCNPVEPAHDFGANDFYIRVSRAGDAYSLSSSDDGKTFVPVGPAITGLTDLTQIGMAFTCNFAGTIANVDYFEVTPLLPGDANGDGIVDQADYTIWYNHYGQTGADWDQGDFTREGIVDQADYTLWYNAYGSTGASVPEPCTLGLLILGATWTMRRRAA